MDHKDMVSEHMGRLLCRRGILVTDMLGIQSQFLRYSKWAARVRGIDLDAEAQSYFRAWTLRGTMHVHHLQDYPLYMHAGNRSSYMKEYWEDHSVISLKTKAASAEHMLRLIAAGVTKKQDIIQSFQEKGASKATMDYLFNAWGGLPRILMERGEILHTLSDELSYTFAPKVSIMSAEQAELVQMQRYLENYAPCSIRDAVYFFRYTKSKTKRLMEQCVSASAGALYWQDGVVRTEVGSGSASQAANNVFVLPGFDPLLVGYEKKENEMIPAEQQIRALTQCDQCRYE